MTIHPQHTEKALLALVADGDEKAFAELFRLYHNKLGVFVERLTHSRPLAQEIVQDVFLKIWTNRVSLSSVEHFDSYLFIVSRNHTFNALKKLSREHNRLKKWASNLVEENIPENDLLVYKEYETLIKKAVDQLPAQQKKVFQLSREAGFKHEEIASQLQLSKETVKKHMSLALQSIRSYLSGHIHPDLFLLLMLWGSWSLPE